MSKKKTVKKSVKKKAKKKTTKKHYPLKIPMRSLDCKVLRILDRVGIIPTSGISKDRHGRLFCHTRAEEVYELFKKEMIKKDINLRIIVSDMKIVQLEGKVNCLIGCTMLDCDSGETDTFYGAGDGDNGIWSANSAQTIALKQAVLMYFFTAWPEPDDTRDIAIEFLKDTKISEIRDKIAKADAETDLGTFFKQWFANERLAKLKKDAGIK